VLTAADVSEGCVTCGQTRAGGGDTVIWILRRRTRAHHIQDGSTFNISEYEKHLTAIQREPSIKDDTVQYVLI
jgi:hypothetical protein